MPKVQMLVPRHRVRWRTIGRQDKGVVVAHGILLIQRGRLNFETLCGRPLHGLNPDYAATDYQECRHCVAHLEPT